MEEVGVEIALWGEGVGVGVHPPPGVGEKKREEPVIETEPVIEPVPPLPTVGEAATREGLGVGVAPPKPPMR